MPVPGVLECTFHFLSAAQLSALEQAAKLPTQERRALPPQVAESLSLAERMVVFNHLNDEAKRVLLLEAIAEFRAKQAKR